MRLTAPRTLHGVLASFSALLPLLTGSAIAVETWWLPDYYVPEQLLAPEDTPGFHVGPLDLFPRISTSVVYDDNVNISHTSGTRHSDVVWSLSPGLSAVLGAPGEKSLTLSYTPAFVFYVDRSEYNSIDHAANLRGLWPFSKLTLGFSQGFQVRSGGVAEVGRRVEQTSYSTALTSQYELGGKTSVEINGSQQITEYGERELYNSRTWANDNWVNYQVLSKVTMGPGFSIGYQEADQHTGQLFERATLRASYALAAKVNVSAWGGGEWRQSDDRNTFAPVFSLSGSYTPREGTALTLEGHRKEQNSSVLARQNYISTGFSLGINQRLMQRYQIHVTGGYDSLEYRSTARGVSADREDDTYIIRVGMDTLLLRRVSTGIFYQHRDNISNESNFRFSNNQVGVVASYSF